MQNLQSLCWHVLQKCVANCEHLCVHFGVLGVFGISDFVSLLTDSMCLSKLGFLSSWTDAICLSKSSFRENEALHVLQMSCYFPSWTGLQWSFVLNSFICFDGVGLLVFFFCFFFVLEKGLIPILHQNQSLRKIKKCHFQNQAFFLHGLRKCSQN